MELFDVYPLFDITPVRAEGCYIWDDRGNGYLDLYGGHAVISVGHSHPCYVKKITTQLQQIGFYSNSVNAPLQKELADKLEEVSGLSGYRLFLCNSGAEANENALKVASFATGRRKVVYFGKAFHGRTSGAVAVTDNPAIISPFNVSANVVRAPWGNVTAIEEILKTKEIAAVIIEGIQGVGGVRIPPATFMQELQRLCRQHGTMLILDEIQSGYGRTGKFFAFQHYDINPDIVTMAKGMGNGFPMGGVLISEKLKAWHGMLGTTFGGNYLACAAGMAVLEIMQHENLIANAAATGSLLIKQLSALTGSHGIKEVRGVGLMTGIEFEKPIRSIRLKLLHEEYVFTGASGTSTIRLLPPLTLNAEQATLFVDKFRRVLETEN